MAPRNDRDKVSRAEPPKTRPAPTVDAPSPWFAGLFFIDNHKARRRKRVTNTGWDPKRSRRGDGLEFLAASQSHAPMPIPLVASVPKSMRHRLGFTPNGSNASLERSVGNCVCGLAESGVVVITGLNLDAEGRRRRDVITV